MKEFPLNSPVVGENFLPRDERFKILDDQTKMTEAVVSPAVVVSKETAPDTASSEALIESLKGDMERARTEYVTQLGQYRTGLRARKEQFARLMGSLGTPERQLPAEAYPSVLVSAGQAYQEAEKVWLRAMEGSRIQHAEDSAVQIREMQRKILSEREQKMLDKAGKVWTRASSADKATVGRAVINVGVGTNTLDINTGRLYIEKTKVA